MNEYRGRCHCGSAGYTYRTALEIAEWPVRGCQCRFCRAHDAQTTSHPDATVDFSAAAGVHHYRFGLRTADFLICRRCGAYLGALISTEKGSFGIVNLRLLDPVIDNLPPTVAADYDSEDIAARIERREHRWAPASLVGG